ncbi:MAG: DUF3047 domain-containing protein [Polaromonas sp.]|nr:DUF3047 domain-containing protein [Polaromonas sp.]
MQTNQRIAFIFILAGLCLAAQAQDIFSKLSPGQAMPKDFRLIAYPNVKPNKFSLVLDEGKTVLKVDSSNSAGSMAVPAALLGPQTSTTLQWRWKVDRILDNADMDEPLADDHSARLYVFFDVPIESLPFADRTKIKLARSISGIDVPTAALCYVWDNKHRVGYTAWSPFTQRLRKVVLQSGPSAVGQWRVEARDVAADFKQAFGFDAPAITGISVGNDTDNTDERVTSWFGDVGFKK